MHVLENDNLPIGSWQIYLSNTVTEVASIEIVGDLIEYTLAINNFVGTDSFQYLVCQNACPDNCDSTMVTLSFIDDCIAEVIGINAISKAFSPNDDGINDYFDPIQKFIDLQCPVATEEIELLILNRWGEVVYKPSTYKAWDGKRSGSSSKSFPPATYYYVLKMKKLDGEEVVVKGPISIYEK